MLADEIEQLREAVRHAEAELEDSDFAAIDRNLARYIRLREQYSKRLND